MGQRLTSRVRTALRFVREGRFRALRATVARGLFPAPVFRRNRLIIAAVEDVPSPSGLLPGFDLRWGSRRDLPRLVKVRNRPREFEQFFGAGCLCLLGELAGEPASFSWIELEHSHVSRPNAYCFPLGPGAAWAFGFTGIRGIEDEELFHHHWWWKMRLLKDAGISEVFLAVQSDDELERRAHRNAGFEMVFELDLLRVCGATFHRVGDLSRGGARLSAGFGSWEAVPRPPR